MGIVEIGLSELRQEINKKETLDDYYLDMLHSCRKIYDKYKTKINKAEFSEYYWMGIDFIKLDELSKKYEEKEK